MSTPRDTMESPVEFLPATEVELLPRKPDPSQAAFERARIAVDDLDRKAAAAPLTRGQLRAANHYRSILARQNREAEMGNTSLRTALAEVTRESLATAVSLHDPEAAVDAARVILMAHDQHTRIVNFLEEDKK